FMSAALTLFLWNVIKKMKSDPPRSVGHAVGYLLAGIVLVDALAVSSISMTTSWALVCLLPLVFFWQRKIAAT
ncbi:MAG: hypothetical protein WCN98_10595, partial [Verrucomicrobiaceae bacterium]